MKRLFSAIGRLIRGTDATLTVLALISAIYGTVLIYSATRSFESNRFIIVQAAAIVLGVISMYLLSYIDYEALSGVAKYIFVLCLLAVVLTLTLGVNINGNRNWIRIGSVGIQLSELVKVGFIITFSAHIHAVGDDINSIKNVFLLLLHAGIICGSILLQSDMGSALVFLFMTIVMLFGAGLKKRYFLGFSLIAAACLPIIWTNVLRNDQRNRILVGFNPDLDPKGWGFQAVQSRQAVGSGQLFGKGLLNGVRSQSNQLLPAKQTDFIFSVAAEELGFIGAIIIILLLTAIILRILYIGATAKSDLGSLICTGVFSMILFQTIENIGMCLALLPVIGITLPFFSYGGSSILGVFCALGLVQSVYRHRKFLSFYNA